MIIWSEFQGEKSEWNEAVFCLNNKSYAQMYNWGEVKSQSHWNIQRIVGKKNNKIVSASQVLFKKLPFNLLFIWIPGGPVGPIEFLDNLFFEFLQTYNKVSFLYCKADFQRTFNDFDINFLNKNNWFKSSSSINSGLSMIYNPSLNINQRTLECSKNWKRNLKRSIQKSSNPYKVDNITKNELIEIYTELNDYKSLENNTDFDEMALIISEFKNNIIFYRCDNLDGKLMSLRASLFYKNIGWDMYAATSIEGRKLYSSHNVFWELMNACSSKGINYYDMSGIDPEKNPGVFNFKKGTGAKKVGFVGEWNYCSNIILRAVFYLIFKIRK